jgi:hypothetical protein
MDVVPDKSAARKCSKEQAVSQQVVACNVEVDEVACTSQHSMRHCDVRWTEQCATPPERRDVSVPHQA